MSFYIYLGSFSPVREGGYDVYTWDPEKGPGELVQSVFPQISAGMTCFDRKRNIVYFTNERAYNKEFQFGGGGEIYAVKADPATGKLTEINHTLSYGSRPSYCSLTGDGKHLITSNFGSFKIPSPVCQVRMDESGKWIIKEEFDDSTTALHAIREDGSIGELEDLILYEARREETQEECQKGNQEDCQKGNPEGCQKGNPEGCQEEKREGCQEEKRESRQEEPQGNPRWLVSHAHSTVTSPDGSLCAVCDLGFDSIYMYRIQGKRFSPESKTFHTRKGYGPRYSCFHPAEPFFFVNYEDSSQISSFSYEPDGTLTEISTVSVLPENYTATPADLQSGIAISPDGRYLSTCIRGINQIAVFKINQETGELTKIQNYCLAGDRPKDCVYSPDGKYLAVASRGNDCAEFLSVGADGKLTDSGKRITKKACGHIFYLEF